MPKVMFVNEHREVEVQTGRLISDVAAELGIQVCREEFAGTGIGDYTVWVKGGSGCVSPPTFYERVIKRCKGQRRMANRTKVLGDCEVWTQGGMSPRQGKPRPIAAAPRAGEDGSARFDHENNAAGTAWHPYGHPHAVGSGTREPNRYEPPQKKTKAKAEAKDKPEKAKADKPAKAAPKPNAEPAADEADDAAPANGEADAGAKSNEAKSNEAKPNEAKSNEAKPNEAKPAGAKSKPAPTPAKADDAATDDTDDEADASEPDDDEGDDA